MKCWYFDCFTELGKRPIQLIYANAYLYGFAAVIYQKQVGVFDHFETSAALRWHGYRYDHRYTVFQSLAHTLNLEKATWRVLDKYHDARNLAEYEGRLDVNPKLLNEFISVTTELHKRVKALAPMG